MIPLIPFQYIVSRLFPVDFSVAGDLDQVGVGAGEMGGKEVERVGGLENASIDNEELTSRLPAFDMSSQDLRGCNAKTVPLACFRCIASRFFWGGLRVRAS